MLRAYPAGKISDDDPVKEAHNIQLLKDLTIAIIKLGCSPYPTAYTSEWGEKWDVTREQYYALDNEWLDVSDVVVVQPIGWENSIGTIAEVKRAKERDIKVVFGAAGLAKWLADLEASREAGLR